jgi:hypothetical protein
MDAALSRNEPTSQTERSCAPPFLQLPSSTSLKIEDPGEWRPQARETSPHLLPVAGFRAKRRNRATSSIFWPGTSVYSYCGTSSPVPAATCRARKPEKGRRDSISRTPAPGHSSIYSAPFKGNHRASVLNQFSKKALFDNHSSSADNSICRHHSNRILPTVPRDQDSLAGERNSHNDDTLFSIPYEQISPAGRNSTLLKAMVSRFEDSDDDDGPCDEPQHDRIGTGDFIDAGTGHEDSHRNDSTPMSSTKHSSDLLGFKNFRTRIPARLSSLASRIDSAGLRKRSVRRGKRPASRPTISGPRVPDAHGHSDANGEPDRRPSRSRAAAASRLHAIGEAQFLRTRRPLTPSTLSRSRSGASSAGTNARAGPRPSRMQSLRHGLSRKRSQKMRLEHAGEHALVISDVMAVDRWGHPMQQYPTENGLKWLEGEVEHTEKIAWAKRKAESGPGGEEREGKRRSRVGLIVSEGSRDGEGKRRVKNMIGERNEVERQEREDCDILRRRSIKSDLCIGSSSGKILGVSQRVKDGAMQEKSNISERAGEIEDNMIRTPLTTTPKLKERKRDVNIMQDSPNDSGYGGEVGSSSTRTPNDKAGSGGKTHQYSPTDFGYSGSSEGKNSPPPPWPSRHSESPRSEAEAQMIRQRVQESIVQPWENYSAETDERHEFVRRLARKENEIALREKRDRDMEDELFVEQLQLQHLKEQHLSWWEKLQSQPKARTVRQRKAVQEKSRQRSRIPVPIKQKTKTNADGLMSNTPEQRLSDLKAAKKEVFDHARMLADCVMSLDNISFSPSTKKQRKGPVWLVGDGSDDSHRGNRITSSDSWSTIPELAEVRHADEARSSLNNSSADDKLKPPPIPERSSRRAKFHLPFREQAIVGPSASSSSEPRQASQPVPSEVKEHMMPPAVYRHWPALQDELKERFDVADLSIVGELSTPVSPEDRHTFTPEPLTLGNCRERQRAEHIMDTLRYAPSDFGDGFF